MADSRRQTRSSQRQGQQTNAQFWSNQPDPVLIERGQADAIRLVRSTVNSTPGAATVNEHTEMNATGASVPQWCLLMMKVWKNNVLQKMKIHKNIPDTMANCVTTPVDTIPLNQGTEQEEELDLQPSRGPREESLVNTIDQFLDENYEDVLRTSNIQRNFSLSASNRNLIGHPVLPLGWIFPDGMNRTLEEIKDKKISNDRSPGGGKAGAVVMSLKRLEPYYRTQFFLVDLETGEMFAYIQQQWRRAGLYCSKQPFDLVSKVEHHGQAMWAEMEASNKLPWWISEDQQHSLKFLHRYPAMDEPAVYVLHPDVMQVNIRKNYVRDRMRATLIYISEYMETKRMMTEGRYNNEELLIRLRAVFGHVDQVRDHIDTALQQDDAHCRKRDMRFLIVPTRFPRPESMGQGDIAVWTNWIHQEMEEIMKQLEEERDSRSDPDDPFNGTVNDVFLPLQDPLSLPPPVQTPK